MRTGYQRGYTLIEVMLVTAVTLLIASVPVVSFAPLLQQVSLEEGVNRFESLLRFAKAEAANSGCKIQIQFAPGERTNSARAGFKPLIAIEQDPFNSPGVFENKPELLWMNSHIEDLILIESIHCLDPPDPPIEYATLPEFTQQPNSGSEFALPSPITFYPDGSSDSAEFVLASADETDIRRIQIRLVGLTGEISQKPLSETNQLGSEGESMDDEFLFE